MPIHSGPTLIALQVLNEERGKTRDLGTLVPYGVRLAGTTDLCVVVMHFMTSKV